MFGKIFTLAPCKETDKMFANLKIKLTDKPTLKGYTPVKKLFRDLKKRIIKKASAINPRTIQPQILSIFMWGFVYYNCSLSKSNYIINQ